MILLQAFPSCLSLKKRWVDSPMAVRDSVKHIGAVQRSCIKLLYVKNVCGLMTELLICSHSSPLFSSPHPPLFNPPPPFCSLSSLITSLLFTLLSFFTPPLTLSQQHQSSTTFQFQHHGWQICKSNGAAKDKINLKKGAQNKFIARISNLTNTLLLLTQKESGKCDYWCCLFAFLWLLVEQCLYLKSCWWYHVSSTNHWQFFSYSNTHICLSNGAANIFFFKWHKINT